MVAKRLVSLISLIATGQHRGTDSWVSPAQSVHCIPRKALTQMHSDDYDDDDDDDRGLLTSPATGGQYRGHAAYIIICSRVGPLLRGICLNTHAHTRPLLCVYVRHNRRWKETGCGLPVWRWCGLGPLGVCEGTHTHTHSLSFSLSGRERRTIQDTEIHF